MAIRTTFQVSAERWRQQTDQLGGTRINFRYFGRHIFQLFAQLARWKLNVYFTGLQREILKVITENSMRNIVSKCYFCENWTRFRRVLCHKPSYYAWVTCRITILICGLGYFWRVKFHHIKESNTHDVSSLLGLVKIFAASQHKRQRKKSLSRLGLGTCAALCKWATQACELPVLKTFANSPIRQKQLETIKTGFDYD